jgi:hypothetical protein
MSKITLSELRRFIKKLKSLDISIIRHIDYPYCAYDGEHKAIIIPRRIRKQPVANPIISLYHEAGHALASTRLDKTTLSPLESLDRFKNNRRYFTVRASLLDFVKTPENLITGDSEKIKILKAYRKLRHTLFSELQANTAALKEMPESFKAAYNLIAAQNFNNYRVSLITYRHRAARSYFFTLLHLTEKPFI